MADKPNIRSDRDNVHIIHKEEQEAIDKIGPLRMPENPPVEGAKPAESFWSTGRKCPRCANRLTIFELNEESGILHVECRSCGGRWGHEQLESPESDAMFREIPEEMKQRWMRAREEELKRKGLW